MLFTSTRRSLRACAIGASAHTRDPRPHTRPPTTHLPHATAQIYVAGGYCYPALQFNNEYVHGGSPYGPSTIAGGDGSRKPLPEEIAHCKAYASKFAGIVKVGGLG